MEIEDSQENADALDVGENADALDDEEEDPETDDSDLEGDADPQRCRPQRKKNGSGLAGRILSTLMISAGAIADAAQISWTNAVRHSRVDLAEICCTADSQLAGEVISKGGTADRYSHWNGYDLTTRKGTDALRSKLESTRPRWIGMSPPCGPDSPMQNLNQRTDTQMQRLEEKRSRAHRIQKNLLETFTWLQGTPWCE